MSNFKWLQTHGCHFDVVLALGHGGELIQGTRDQTTQNSYPQVIILSMALTFGNGGAIKNAHQMLSKVFSFVLTVIHLIFKYFKTFRQP